MIESQFRALCRFNRLLILLTMAASLSALLDQPATPPMAMIAGISVLHMLTLFSNEFMLKVVKRIRDAELQTIQHLGMAVPCLLAVYATLSFWLSGNVLVGLLAVFSVLEAQFLGQVKLSRILMVILTASYAIAAICGVIHPLMLGLVQQHSLLAGIATAMFAYGAMVSSVLRTHSSEVGKLQSLAATDALTKLTNRRQFNARLHEEISRARRHETPLSLALFDLDDFKRLNDFYGHQVGDRILRELGKLIRHNIRESDLPARYGGEEFALILPETRETEAYELLERIRLLVAQTVFCLPENPLTITISVGLAQLDARQHTAFELIELADKALYEAKRQGKNQVVKGSNLIPKVLLKAH